jgi:hypothetical protein
MIIAVLEVPNYGQYIPTDYFNAFIYSFPYLWAEKKYWDVNSSELPFDFLDPFTAEYNSLRTNALCVIYLMLNESCRDGNQRHVREVAFHVSLMSQGSLFLWAQ